MEKINTFIREWYEGLYIKELPGSPFILGRYQRHWTSNVAHKILEFYSKEWKWLLPFIVGLISLFIALNKS